MFTLEWHLYLKRWMAACWQNAQSQLRSFIVMAQSCSTQSYYKGCKLCSVMSFHIFHYEALLSIHAVNWSIHLLFCSKLSNSVAAERSLAAVTTSGCFCCIVKNYFCFVLWIILYGSIFYYKHFRRTLHEVHCYGYVSWNVTNIFRQSLFFVVSKITCYLITM